MRSLQVSRMLPSCNLDMWRSHIANYSSMPRVLVRLDMQKALLHCGIRKICCLISTTRLLRGKDKQTFSWRKQVSQKPIRFVQSTGNSTAYTYLDAATLGQESMAAGMLANAGAMQPQLVEQFFSSDMLYNARIGLTPANFTTYRYAQFLANEYGATRQHDITTLLSSITTQGTSTATSTLQTTFISARNGNLFPFDHPSLVLLASIDSSFKSYLLSLGWQTSDFAPKS